MSQRSLCLQILAAAAMFAPAAALADADNNQLTVTAIAASDWLYHGTSETDDHPALGLNIEWQNHRGVYLGIQGHQARERGLPQRERSVMGYAGYAFRTPTWQHSIAVAQREFPGSQKDWQFTEFSFETRHASGLGLRLDYSPDYYAHDTRSVALELRYLHAFASGWYGQLAGGRVELSSDRWLDHHYAILTLGRSMGAFNVEMLAHWNNQGDGRAFGRENYSDPSVALQIGWRLW